MCYFNYISKKKLKNITLFFIYFIPLTIILYLVLYSFLPQSSTYTKPTLFQIKRGYSLKVISFKLYKEHIISNPYLFYFIGFISGYSRYIEAGAYFVSINKSPASLYYEFVNGNIATAKVTITPGMNIFEIAKILDKKGIVNEAVFIKACFNKNMLLHIGIERKSIEGFLYPNTYIFKINSNPKNILKKMYGEFKLKTKSIKINYADLIIASLIIKETYGKKDMENVSTVFHNRLKINMPLDSDPANIYAEDLRTYRRYFAFNNLNINTNKKKHINSINIIRNAKKIKSLKFPSAMNNAYLKIKSPYNTYLNYGLPPTPISNPNIKAIYAASHPAKKQYLYFISIKTGKTIFADTLGEQTYNIDNYLK